MPIYRVIAEEHLIVTRTIEVEANSPSDAVDRVSELDDSEWTELEPGDASPMEIVEVVYVRN